MLVFAVVPHSPSKLPLVIVFTKNTKVSRAGHSTDGPSLTNDRFAARSKGTKNSESTPDTKSWDK